MLNAVTDRLRRVTNGRPWIPQIDGLRFLAIAGVLLFHLFGEIITRSGRMLPVEPRYTALAWSLGNGDRGVRLFFVISGLVLALPFARHFLARGKPVRLKSYFLRRITRIEPPYVLAIVLCFLMLAVYTHGFSADLLRHAVASLLYLHSPMYGTFSPVSMVAWSLEVEVQFYLIAPLFMQVFRIHHKWRRRIFLTVLIVISIPIESAVLSSYRLNLSLIRYVGYFLAGLLAADIFVLDVPGWRQRGAWDIVAIACVAAPLALRRDWEAASGLLPFLFAALCIAAMLGPVTSRCLATPWVAVIGGMCYSIYLTHMTVIAVVFKVSRHLLFSRLDFFGNYLLQCAILIPAVLLAGSGFYLLIERPCMDPQWPLELQRWFVKRKQLTRS